MRRAVVVLVVSLLGALAPAAARAQSPAAPPPAASETGVPAPVAAQLTLNVERVGGLRATTLTGSRIIVRGTTTVFVPGQTVNVRFYERGRKQGAKRVTLLPGAAGTGVFAHSYRPVEPGPLSIRAAHDPTPQLGGLAARAATVDVLPRRVVPRSGRASIRALQTRLRRLGYVTGAPGVFDGRTSRAVLAFRKVPGMARTTTASVSSGARSRAAGAPSRSAIPSMGATSRATSRGRSSRSSTAAACVGSIRPRRARRARRR